VGGAVVGAAVGAGVVAATDGAVPPPSDAKAAVGFEVVCGGVADEPDGAGEVT
jgi:hypothetical protein